MAKAYVTEEASDKLDVPTHLTNAMYDALNAVLARAPGPLIAIAGLKLALKGLIAATGAPPYSTAEEVKNAEKMADDFMRNYPGAIESASRQLCELRCARAQIEPSEMQAIAQAGADTVQTVIRSVNDPFAVFVILTMAKRLATVMLEKHEGEQREVPLSVAMAGIENEVRRTKVEMVVVPTMPMSKGGDA